MRVSLKNYTLRHLSISFLLIIAVWAVLFYAYILEEVYDNVDDGLKNQKIEILREVYRNLNTLNINEYGVNQFRIISAEGDVSFSEDNNFSREFFYMPYDDEEEPYRVLRTGFYDPEGVPYHLEIRTSTVEEDDLMLDLSTALIVLYLVLVLSLYLINEFVLRKAWGPFNVIIDNLNLYRFGKKEQLAPINTNVIEFQTLYNEIVDMWRRNEEVFNEQKLFIENASHELQTPLAVTINKLELLMEDLSLNEGQLTAIAEAKSSLMRLVGLNKSLLMLSRISNRQYSEVLSVNLNQIVHETFITYQSMIEYKEVEFQLNDKGSFVITMNPDLAEVLFANLLRNAIKYTEKGGKIIVDITDDCLRVLNSSNGSALDTEKVFNRFHKGEQDNQSNGLGLAIVKSIVDLYPFLHIMYSYTGGKHIFALRYVKS
ncbi:HAMP domain-containing sensor histidine kinase [Sphingobacterium sp. UT-1RO-CII-1]|uniref:sensor histidine kinase n=1 Tax=Sphingobacterium sp. UT-1RO-CII-1 TaxID=2995225 RepID=UPI00227CA1F8|nr:HAMP domain-containing sensor histidine kinase [Sphingobacterium sp. UT-1RO-CII-1]MCY4779723.1 HAMP domain-containing sensor histidine kinase [Sphingobacterium sp. UT-1RO-CII-1]